MYINTYAPEYLPNFEGNCYAQFSDALFLSSLSAPCFWAARPSGIRDLLEDGDGEILTLSRNTWGDLGGSMLL